LRATLLHYERRAKLDALHEVVAFLREEEAERTRDEGHEVGAFLREQEADHTRHDEGG
jgi:hypothetical protein